MKIMTTEPEDEETTSSCGNGRNGSLPACSPLAVPFVPFQGEDPQRYQRMDALSEGTLFPGLNLPFRIKPEATTVISTPLAELQALGFVITELSLYLDTHPKDSEAFALYQTYANLLKEGRKTYAEKYGPLTHLEVAQQSNYTWLNDPWPWEGGMA
jgi:spore coat protein JB